MTERVITCWPRLLDVHLAAAYLSVGASTIRDWVVDGILIPVSLPGSILREPNGRIIARSASRKLSKILIDKNDLDNFIEQRKRQS